MMDKIILNGALQYVLYMRMIKQLQNCLLFLCVRYDCNQSQRVMKVIFVHSSNVVTKLVVVQRSLEDNLFYRYSFKQQLVIRKGDRKGLCIEFSFPSISQDPVNFVLLIYFGDN